MASLLPQIDLDNQGSKLSMDAGQSSAMDVAGADFTNAVQSSPLANGYYGGLEALSNTPIKYNNAIDYSSKVLSSLMGYNIPQDNPQLTPEEANAKYWQPGMNKFSSPVHEQAAQIMATRQGIINQANTTIDRANFGKAAGIANGVFGSAFSLLDPTQDVMYFVPVVGEEALYGKIAGALGKGLMARAATTTIRMAGEMTRGSLWDNAVDYAAKSPFGQQSTLGEYAHEDLINVASATGLGVFLKSIAKSWAFGSKAFSKLGPETQEHIKNSLSSEQPAAINDVLAGDTNVSEIEGQIGQAIARSMADRLDGSRGVDIDYVANMLNPHALQAATDSVHEAMRNVGADAGLSLERKQKTVAMLGRFTDAVNEYSGSTQYFKPDADKIISEPHAPDGTSVASQKAVSRQYLADLHPAVESVSDALNMYKTMKSSKVERLTVANTADTRARLLTSDIPYQTANDLRSAGMHDAANKVEQLGNTLKSQRVQEVFDRKDKGDLDPPPPTKMPEPKIEAPKEGQEGDVKLLNDVMKSHDDLVKELQKDPEANAHELSTLEDGMKAADDEITRVKGQKSLLQMALSCALGNGL